MQNEVPLLDLYRTMRRIRTFEEHVGQLYVRQLSAGSMLHLSIGEEGAAAGVCAAMQPQDTFTTHHRGHGIFLARGASPNQMMAEIGGKAAGYCHGKGGSMHIADMKLGHLGANAIVGGGIPLVVGAGLSYKRQKKGAISVAFFGDGAMQQGVLYESMNMAALWNLPVLFVCINNQYGMGTRIDKATRHTDFDKRAQALGLNTSMVSGDDVEDVHWAADGLITEARKGGPGFMSVSCFRFYGHGRMDKSPYRSAEEEEAGRRRDPVALARTRLLERHAVTTQELDTLDEVISDEMRRSIDFTADALPPDPSAMFRDIYADGQPAPESLGQRIDRVLAQI